jgi:Domain of unknown function (DUF4126)
VELIVKLLAGVGISVSCGLNAFLPLLAISALAKAKRITLAPGFEFIENWAFLLVMLGLVTIMLVVDKIPAVESLLSKAYIIIRPVAGGLAFAAIASTQMIAPLSFVLGAGLAGAMHYFNSNIQPAIANRSPVMVAFRPALSLGQDFVAVVLTVLAIFVPLVGGVLGIVVLGLSFWWMNRLKKAQPATETGR